MFEEYSYIDRILYFKVGEMYLFWWFVFHLVVYFIFCMAINIIDEIIKVKEKYESN